MAGILSFLTKAAIVAHLAGVQDDFDSNSSIQIAGKDLYCLSERAIVDLRFCVRARGADPPASQSCGRVKSRHGYNPMLLTDILTPQRLKVPLTGSTKQGVIEELLDLLTANGDITDRDCVLQAVLEREKTRTTGIGNGLAIPHAKCSSVMHTVMAIGTSPSGVEFDSIDQKPVTLVVLLVSPPDKTGPHIQALARISRLMTIETFRNKLDKAESAGEIYQIIKDQEQGRQS